jgi:protoheme IX farnesyltransferase
VIRWPAEQGGTTIVSDTSIGAQPAAGAAGSVSAALVDFTRLLKPRVMSLVVFTGFVGLYLAPGSLHPVLESIAILCIAVGAGASGAINMWYDRDIDAVMTRTRGRPIPAGRVGADEALTFGVVLAGGSVMVMGLAVNWLAAGLLALTIGFYVFVYTMWLKRRTPQNIVIGGAAGAFPPMIGWAAVSGTVSVESLTLFAIIFFWTPPHFWALSLYRSGDYEAAGVPMLPVVAGRRETQKQILLYSLLLAPLGLAPTVLGTVGLLYGVSAAALGALFVHGAWKVWRDASDRNCKRLFGFSILYLFLIFLAMIVDRVAEMPVQAWFGS